MTTPLPIHKITPPSWMRDPDLVNILDTLNHDGINARMVGGCIRNNYLNKPVHDIDIACVFLPNTTSDLLNKAGIRIIPTGITHGTITAHINNKNFEITTLRRDVKTDGRHADVEFSDNWVEDAARRDFTINALYADRDGSIYDPLGHGFDDLQNRIVRFIGNPEMRIREDFLRILRFFRFFADYHDGAPHAESFTACATLKDGMDTLSKERIFDELQKILMSDNAPRAISAMQSCNLFDIPNNAEEQLKILICDQNLLDAKRFEPRYITAQISLKYIKNNNLNVFINKLNGFKKFWDNDITHAIYHFEREVVIQGLLLLKSEGVSISDQTIADAMNLKPPLFPIVAQDIMDQFKIPEGREVGIKLKQAEAIWIESAFKMPREKILKNLMDSQR